MVWKGLNTGYSIVIVLVVAIQQVVLYSGKTRGKNVDLVDFKLYAGYIWDLFGRITQQPHVLERRAICRWKGY